MHGKSERLRKAMLCEAALLRGMGFDGWAHLEDAAKFASIASLERIVRDL